MIIIINNDNDNDNKEIILHIYIWRCSYAQYRYLSHALKNTANQRLGLPLQILQYATGSIPLFFSVITCAQQFTGVLLRTSPKFLNSCEPVRTSPITTGNFPMISEHFQRFSENFKKL